MGIISWKHNYSLNLSSLKFSLRTKPKLYRPSLRMALALTTPPKPRTSYSGQKQYAFVSLLKIIFTR